jgi:hypothetical protein
MIEDAVRVENELNLINEAKKVAETEQAPPAETADVAPEVEGVKEPWVKTASTIEKEKTIQREFEQYYNDLYEHDKADLENVLKDDADRLEMLRDYLNDEHSIRIREDGLIEFWDLTPEVEKIIGDKPVVVNHYTSDAILKDVSEKGLLPNIHNINRHGAEGDGIYVTTETSGPAVEGYGRAAAGKLGGNPVYILSLLRGDFEKAKSFSNAIRNEIAKPKTPAQLKAEGEQISRDKVEVPTVEEVAIKPEKPAIPAKKTKKQIPSKIVTLRGALKKLGPINWGHRKSELKDAPLWVKKISKVEGGMPFDIAEQALKDDERNWLGPDEDLIDVINIPKNATRRPLGSIEGVPESQLTEEEKRFREESKREPEAPPEGEYVTMTAEDLPTDKKLTLLEDKTADGWDVYEVTEKDEFEVTLTDGQTITLKPLDRVQVLKKDLGKKKLELKGEKETAVSVARLKRKKAQAKQETLTTAFETAKDKQVEGIRLEGEKAGKKEAEAFEKVVPAKAKDIPTFEEYKDERAPQRNRIIQAKLRERGFATKPRSAGKKARRDMAAADIAKQVDRHKKPHRPRRKKPLPNTMTIFQT